MAVYRSVDSIPASISTTKQLYDVDSLRPLPLYGNLETTSDHDWYKVQLIAGQNYIFNVNPTRSEYGLKDSTLTLRDSSGKIVKEDRNGGLAGSARIEFNSQNTGTYFLDVGGEEGSKGGYYLWARVDDVPNDVGTYRSIAASRFKSTIHAKLDYIGDSDFFRVNLEANRSYIFETSANGPSGIHPELVLYSQVSEQPIQRDRGGGFEADSRILFTPKTSGLYFISVQDLTGAGVGGYNLSVRADDVVDDIYGASKLRWGMPASGHLEIANDHDFYEVTLEQNSRTNLSFIDKDSPGYMSMTSYVDPGLTLTVRDYNGNALQVLESSGLGSAGTDNFIPNYTGAYFLDVTSSAVVNDYIVSARAFNPYFY